MGLPSARQSVESLTDVSSRPEVRSAACLNCNDSLTGPYCANCGQRDIPPYPSVRELVVDAFWELSGWDGRFAATIRALLRHPGMLTREFLEGRRARYISPLRLYLMASLAYFLLAAAVPEVRLPNGKTVRTVSVSTTLDAKELSTPERVANEASTALQKQQVLTPEQRDKALKDIAHAPSVLRPFLRKAVTDPVGLKRGLMEAMPRMLFALLPVFAAIISLFYRRRKYAEHLYFAIHLNAFMFLALGVTKLVQFTRLASVTAAVGLAALVWLVVYSTVAFRRTYGGSVVGTVAKEVAIGTIYSVAAMTAFVGVLYWIAVAG